MTKKYIALGVVLLILIPLVSFAWSPGDPLIPCGQNGPDCDFGSLITLGANIVSALFIFSIPIVALVFAYAGYLYLSAGGSQTQAEKAKKMFTKVAFGFVVMMSAWLLVKFIQDNLLSSEVAIPEEVKLK